ncbi:unnamed protein product [Brassica oleracea var. botrytis]
MTHSSTLSSLFPLHQNSLLPFCCLSGSAQASNRRLGPRITSCCTPKTAGKKLDRRETNEREPPSLTVDPSTPSHSPTIRRAQQSLRITSCRTPKTAGKKLDRRETNEREPPSLTIDPSTPSHSQTIRRAQQKCSPALQKLQHQDLKCTDESSSEKKAISSLAGTPVHWHATLEEAPSGGMHVLPTIIIAHEFYDALPVHQFQVCVICNIVFSFKFSMCILNGLTLQKSPRGWCEKMVDVEEDSQFRFVLSPQPIPAALYLEKEKLEHVEISPKSMDLTQEIAKRIGSDGGGALIIDYGKDGIILDSLQAIREHKFVNILDNPGSADLSAYVDFPSIKHSAEEASENVTVRGHMTQSRFLGSLGINFRVDALLQSCDDEQAESLRSGYWRLVGDGEAPLWEGPDEQTPIGMGERYLTMAIVSRNQGTPAPFQ